MKAARFIKSTPLISQVVCSERIESRYFTPNKISPVRVTWSTRRPFPVSFLNDKESRAWHLISRKWQLYFELGTHIDFLIWFRILNPARPVDVHQRQSVGHRWFSLRVSLNIMMTTIASQITSLTSVYSTVYSDADQRKHQSSASLAFVWGIHRDRWIPRTKGQLRGKCFHLMTSSWQATVT